jgi:hypothetical protein
MLSFAKRQLPLRGLSRSGCNRLPASVMSAPPKSQKRKRSVHDTPVDLTKMQLARQRLSALQEELRGIEETEAEMAGIMEHVDALQDILGSTKKLVS